jgi:hypothetical protein
MRADLSVIGPAITVPRRIAASATRYEVGEPLHSLAALTSGVADVNTYVLAAADTPVIGTHKFGGVAISRCLPLATGTVVAHTAQASCPIASLSRIRGRGETVANWDTDSELLGLIQDVTVIDYDATGASDGGQLYTIKTTSGADTAGLEIVGGIPALSLVDVVVDPRAYRHDVS